MKRFALWICCFRLWMTNVVLSSSQTYKRLVDPSSFTVAITRSQGTHRSRRIRIGETVYTSFGRKQIIPPRCHLWGDGPKARNLQGSPTGSPLLRFVSPSSSAWRLRRLGPRRCGYLIALGKTVPPSLDAGNICRYLLYTPLSVKTTGRAPPIFCTRIPTV